MEVRLPLTFKQARKIIRVCWEEKASDPSVPRLVRIEGIRDRAGWEQLAVAVLEDLPTFSGRERIINLFREIIVEE